ncbi:MULTISPECIES: ATP-binding protein [Paraburkholderia]|uniref:ATP-binding protein n=1 Tax=Paraburkholderia TaxID=1822464 RepID=UPI00225A2D16|nr:MULTISPECIES: ATP-binding protein [Paraburkholderia]MCX4159286.1 ATP-binding protein [Paraburkholderia aspalathi]MDN7168685.1 ATP-binding protein [Paraburkholderia sp. SECH2]MDQ6397172.1 ATP-binding protein [Paraburkholderia aspalathi]
MIGRDSGSALQRRFRLYNRLAEMAERASGRSLIVFVDEAQRLELEHYEWLRDVQDEMERRGVRMYTLLVGQPGTLNRKTSFRQSIDTSQIVSRFMIEEMRFEGFRSAADLEVSLSAYDDSVFPEGSNWTFTRFFFQRAYDAGFRFGRQNELVWDAFSQVHRQGRFDLTIEIPMEFVARAPGRSLQTPPLVVAQTPPPGSRTRLFFSSLWFCAQGFQQPPSGGNCGRRIRASGSGA